MKYLPDIYKKNIFDINYKKLKDKGIKCLIFDLDNTLTKIDSLEVDKKTLELITKLKTNTTCPTDKVVFLLITKATDSVPSTHPPKWITSPTPSPSKIPPNTVAKSICSVSGS